MININNLHVKVEEKEILKGISLDVKPFIEVATSGNAYFGMDPGLGVKLFF